MSSSSFIFIATGCLLLAFVDGFNLPLSFEYRSRESNRESLNLVLKTSFASRRQNSLACRAAPSDLPQAKDLIGVGDDSTIEDWFKKLADSRQSIRTMASIKIAEMHDADGQVDLTEQKVWPVLQLTFLSVLFSGRCGDQALDRIFSFGRCA